jgi:hypothetical protein
VEALNPAEGDFFLGERGLLPVLVKVELSDLIEDLNRESSKDTFHNLIFLLTK